MTKSSHLRRCLWISSIVGFVSGCSSDDPASLPGDETAGDSPARGAGAGTGDDSDEPDSTATTGDSTSTGGATTTSGTGDTLAGGATSSVRAGGSATASGDDGGASAILPARIRRLTNAEYDASVQALLGTTLRPSQELSFPPDARQGPSNSPAGAAFTVNDAQRVDPVLAGKLDAAAQALVAEARENGKLGELSPCSDPSESGGEACAETFLRSFGEKAYRRPITDDEVTSLVSGEGSAYHVGADGYTYEEGIDLLTRVILQTPAFLYVTELGNTTDDTSLELTPNEIASSLSYILTSGPPDTRLLDQAASGVLATPEGREAEARRLIETPAGRERLVSIVREWLGIDSVTRREKAQSVYPEFAEASQAMQAESRAFISEVLFNSTGSLSELLTADWTIAEAPLEAVYGLTPAGAGQRTSLSDVGRRGILNQGAFLSVFASNNGSHPVFRGVATMRRVACLDTPDPGALGIVVSFPASDVTKTTRARFETHTLDPSCASCHTTIDAFGFAFENFDGIGKQRTAENDLPVDTAVTIATGSDFDGTYADSAELLTALAGSASVKACLARQIFRGTAGRSDASVRGVEDAFVELWRELPAEQQDRLVEVLVAYVRSPLFVERSPQ